MISLHVLQRIKRFEGSIPHMYLDTEGHVTVGVGRLLPNTDTAARLAFVRKEDGKTATDKEKRAEWNLIHALEKAKLPAYYARSATLLLPEDEIDVLLKRNLRSSEGELRGIFTDYVQFSTSAKEALLDMIFNLGRPKFMKYRKLIQAAKKNKWKVCAAESHRRGIQPERNHETRRLFESAAP
jgi:GH24 family phage-related lysozyme (muramidase)